ncbi:MAG: hypothetical protein IJS96_06145 [Schwartzia sp.]|nr:hypothetical protein [Schwartzia sp. (in: firmicutes)]
MKTMVRQTVAGFLAGFLLMGGGLAAGTALAHGFGPGMGHGMGPGMGHPGMECQGEFPRPMIDMDGMAKRIAAEFGVDENEVRTALDARRDFRDIGQAAMLAKISGKSFQDVLAMKTSWFDVAKSLGITREQMRDAVREHTANHIAQRCDAEPAKILALLKDGYQPFDIGFAARLAKASGKDVKDVLAMKKINNRWMDVARELKVDKDALPPGEAPDEGADTEVMF